MSENQFGFKTPRLDAILLRLPKEVSPIWTSYSRDRCPNNEPTEITWKKHRRMLSNLVDNRADYLLTPSSTVITIEDRNYAISEFQKIGAKLATCDKALKILGFLAILESLEEMLEHYETKVHALEGERSLGEDASRRLEEEIRAAREEFQEFEARVEKYEEIVLRKATIHGLLSRTS
ncbi:MAG: hypothetical protein Q9221_007568 [Calogaya cf. arnoldii]